jgi:hypothetical protein
MGKQKDFGHGNCFLVAREHHFSELAFLTFCLLLSSVKPTRYVEAVRYDTAVQSYTVLNAECTLSAG